MAEEEGVATKEGEEEGVAIREEVEVLLQVTKRFGVELAKEELVRIWCR